MTNGAPNNTLEAVLPSISSTVELMPAPSFAGGEPLGYVWERFDSFLFATDNTQAPIPGAHSSRAAAEASVMTDVSFRRDLDFSSPIPA